MSELKACLNSIAEQSFRLSSLIHDKLSGVIAVVETLDEDLFRHLMALGQAKVDMDNFNTTMVGNGGGYGTWTEDQKKVYGEISNRERNAVDALAKLAAIYVNRDNLVV